MSPFGVVVAPNGTRAYVANAGDGTVSVIDTTTNQLARAPIRVGGGAIGIAITPDGNRVYVANRDDSTVSVIDTATQRVGAHRFKPGAILRASPSRRTGTASMSRTLRTPAYRSSTRLQVRCLIRRFASEAFRTRSPSSPTAAVLTWSMNTTPLCR